MIKSKRMRWVGYKARMGERRNAYRILVRKPEENKPLGRKNNGRVDNIKTNLWNTVCVAQNRDQKWTLVNRVTNVWVP
jgi:hypothetical protein